MKVSAFAKRLAALNCAVPAILLSYDALLGQLGANPVNFAIRTTGLLSLIFLMLTLGVTPLARLSGRSWLGTFRRVMGLSAFYYAAAHFAIFFGFDRSASISSTFSEISQRVYLMVGTFAVVAMAPLAATSTDAMIRRLGPRRWKWLHRLTYLVVIAACIHFALLVKADLTRPYLFISITTVLLGYRFGLHYSQLLLDSRQLRRAPPPAAPAKPRNWAGQLKLAKILRETPDVCTFRLVTPGGGPLPFDYAPGQYLNIALVIDGKKVRRSYTIASSPSRGYYCERTVKREAMGLASRHLHDAIAEGTLLDVMAPAGKFIFRGSEADRMVMIAAGVGITPLMSKIRYLTDIAWPGRIDLIFSLKAAENIIFREELDYLQKRFPTLRVHITLTRDTTPGPWRHGRIDAAMLREIVPDLASCRIHICGPTEMTEPTQVLLQELGVPSASIHSESFASPSRGAGDVSAAAKPEAEFAEKTSLTFARSSLRVAMSPTKTILEAAEEAGVPMNYDCRSGICGQCKTKLLAGNVVMAAEDALDARDRGENLILGCQSRCLDEVVIDA